MSPEELELKLVELLKEKLSVEIEVKTDYDYSYDREVDYKTLYVTVKLGEHTLVDESTSI